MQTKAILILKYPLHIILFSANRWHMYALVALFKYSYGALLSYFYKFIKKLCGTSECFPQDECGKITNLRP
jgi:hypothetical protein